MIIGISKGSGHSKYKNYTKWLSAGTPDIEFIDFSDEATPLSEVAKVDAIVLTGGADVNPNLYDSPELMDKCELVDMKRDELEYNLLDYATENKLPILGICRGLQVINVYFGGSLIPHLPDVIQSNLHARINDEDNYHTIQITNGSLIHKVVGELEGEVNSAHHQAINKVASGLAATATSEDGIIEAIEYSDNLSKPFLLAVQWHPERMNNQESSFSKKIKDKFLFEVESSVILRDKKG